MSFYFDILVMICTFDPIPIDMILDFVPVIDFDYTFILNDRPVFSRIGIDDRCFVFVLGSMFLFIILFVFSQALYLLLSVCQQHSYRVRKFMKMLKLESPYRTIVMIFFLETYLDLLFGGLINKENDYLFDDSANWGPNGLLTLGD